MIKVLMFVVVFEAILLSPGNWLHGQSVITTVAGTDITFPRNPVPALSANFGHVDSVIADTQGNIFVSDPDNNMVIMVSKDGIATVFAGNGRRGYSGDGGPAATASLGTPAGLAFDRLGNLYIAEQSNHRVRRVDTAGIITTFAGNGNGNSTGDNGPAIGASMHMPTGVAVDSRGVLYISDAVDHRIRRVDVDKRIHAWVGSGAAGFSGDGGPAISAMLNTPTHLAVDSHDNLYVSDFRNLRLRRISSDGTIVTIAGNGSPGSGGDNGPALKANLNFPYGVVSGTNGIFVSELLGAKIRRIAADGTITTFAGTGQVGYAGDNNKALNANFNSPAGLAVNTAGTLFVADNQNGRIRQVDPSGFITSIAGSGQYWFSGDGGPAIGATLGANEGLFYDRSAGLLVADTNNNRLRKIGGDGLISTLAGNGAFGFTGDGGPASQSALWTPAAVVRDSIGNYYVADRQNNRIRKIAPDGTMSTFAGNGSAFASGDKGKPEAAGIPVPTGLAINAAGTVYISDFSNRVRQVSNGVITTVAGNGQSGNNGDAGLATAAMLNSPNGLASDRAGNIYIADTSNNRIRVLKVDGSISGFAGNGSAGMSGDGSSALSAQLNAPRGVTVDNQQNVIIADTGNNRIRRVTPDGVIRTIAGDGRRGYAGDGALATQASFNSPVSVAVDDAGTVFISDSGNNRIRAILAKPPTVRLSTATLQLTGNAGQNSITGFLYVLSNVAGLQFSASVPANTSWLRTDLASAVTPYGLQITADASNLPPGDYTSSVQIVTPYGSPVSQSVSVVLTIVAGQPSKLIAGNSLLTFSLETGSRTQTKTLNLFNQGKDSLPFTASIETTSGGNWLSLNGTNGIALQNNPSSLNVNASSEGLPAGTYSGAIRILGGDDNLLVPVTMTISQVKPLLLISHLGLPFTVTSHGGNPPSQSFLILNQGNGSMTWSLTSRTITGGDWLRVTPTSGQVNQALVDASTVQVSVNSYGMPPGDYYGTIEINAPSDNSPQSVTVVLTVLPDSGTPVPDIYPASVFLVGSPHFTPGAQIVSISNRQLKNVTYTSSIQSLSGDNWLFHVPQVASITPGFPIRMLVQPDFASLQPGVYRDVITLEFSDGSVGSIRVIAVVLADGASSLSKETSRFASSCAGTNLFAAFTSVTEGFAATKGQPLTIEAKVVDQCGNFLDPESGVATAVSASFSNGDPDVPLKSIGKGTWTGTWKPAAGSAGAVTIKLHAAYAKLGNKTTLQAGDATVQGQLRNPGTVPIVTATSLVHSASFVNSAPVAPGGLITILGQNLADNKQPAITKVLLGGRELPLSYSSDSQINAQVPYDLPVNTQHQLVIQRGDIISVPELFTVAPAQPGVFTTNQQGTGQGIIFKSDQQTLAQPGTPAASGEVIVILCAGLGAVNPVVDPGTPAPSPAPVTVNPVTLTIGGVQAEVDFSGLVPGVAGVYQINAVVPPNTPVGDAVDVVVTVAGQTSRNVTMAVQ